MSDKTITGVVTWLRNWFYTKSEVDSLVTTGGTSISIEDTDLFDVLDCINNNFDNFDIEYLFYDECNSVDGLSSYGNGLSLRNYAKTTLSYDSTMNAYKVTNSAQGCGMIPITVLNGKNDFKFEFDLYSNTGDKGLGFAMKNTSSNDFHYLGFSCYANRNVFWSNNSETIFGNTIAKTTWHHIIITVTSSTITYDIDNGSQTGSFSTYISMNNNVVIGIESQWASGDSGYVKNIKVESL